MNAISGYFHILGTVLFTVLGQLVLKWRIINLGWRLPSGSLFEVMGSFFWLVFDPFILFSFFSAFVASFFWMVAMTKFELTFAYPFMTLAPALVLLISVFWLGETFTIGKVLGLGIIFIGVVVSVRF